MTLQRIKEQVARAGRRLMEAGLIVRTWGNVSARLNNEQFVITPSGKAYERLTARDMVVVNIADESHVGYVKPSSEKGIHAAVYRQRPEINFVIHTHQLFASVVSTLRSDVTDIPPDAAALIGERICCADFALPTTKKLANNVAAALARADDNSKAFLLASHGALCLGEDDEQAFAVALALESVCERFILQRARDMARPPSRQIGGPTRAQSGTWDQVRAHFTRAAGTQQRMVTRPPVRPIYNSERCGDHFKLYLQATANNPFPTGEQDYIRVSFSRAPAADNSRGNRDIPPEAEIHRRIYERCHHIHAIVHETSCDVTTVSQTGMAVRPLLDDFAQIVGVTARSVPHGPLTTMARNAARRLQGRYAVMLEHNGALCCAPTKSDAAAVAHVLAKNCTAIISAQLFGGATPIPCIEALLMRFIYVASYSKRAGR